MKNFQPGQVLREVYDLTLRCQDARSLLPKASNLSLETIEEVWDHGGEPFHLMLGAGAGG